MTVRQAIDIYPTLQKLAKTRQKAKQKALLAKCPCKVYTTLGDIAHNIMHGRIKVTKNHHVKLKRYKHHLRSIASNRSKKNIQKVLNQKGGAAFLPLLIKPALSALASLAINKIFKK